jgi:hypothetical protein
MQFLAPLLAAYSTESSQESGRQGSAWGEETAQEMGAVHPLDNYAPEELQILAELDDRMAAQ